MKNQTFLILKIGIIAFFLTFSFIISAQDGIKRDELDQFIYGMTATNLKSIEEIATYYQIKPETIYQTNQRIGYNYLEYSYGGIIFLPEKTLTKNTNVPYEKIKNIFKELPEVKIEKQLEYPFKDTLAEYQLISDTFLVNFLELIPKTGEEECFSNCAYGIAKIDLGNNYEGFVIAQQEYYNEIHYLYIFKYGDYLQRIKIGGGYGGDSGEERSYTLFQDFNKDNRIDILITQIVENYFSLESEFEYQPLTILDKNWREERQGVSYFYNFLSEINGMYRNVPMMKID